MLVSLMTDGLRFVPREQSGWEELADELGRRLRGRRLAVLTGAGISTESGIPDYRGEETARRARNPIQFREFVANPEGRKRYWARATLGWAKFRGAEPNRAHHELAALESQRLLSGIITQNVDRLHHRAGSRRVVELHGALEDVVCLSCGALEERSAVQTRLLLANPAWTERSFELAPDGDAELDREVLESFRVVDCAVCGGALKPKVVFFGEGVPAEVVSAAFRIYEESEALLIVGSSLAVFSGFRFARRAAAENKPIFIVNVGSTRADPLAELKVPGVASEVLSRVGRWLRKDGS